MKYVVFFNKISEILTLGKCEQFTKQGVTSLNVNFSINICKYMEMKVK